MHESSTKTNTGSGQRLGGKRAVALTATLMLSVLSYQLSATMPSPVLPAIADSLHVSISAVSQIPSTLFLAGAVLGFVFNRWSDYLGRRRILLVALAVQVVGTLLCLFAQDLPLLLIGRVLQGASNASFGFAYLLLAAHLLPRLFGTALGFVSAINGGIGGVDTYLASLITEHFGFRSIFLVILVCSLAAVASAWRIVPRDGHTATSARMDWWGALLLGASLVCLSEIFSTAADRGWSAGGTLGWSGGFLLSTALFSIVEHRRVSPLVPMRQLASRHVWPVLATTVLALAGTFTVMTYIAVLLAQNPNAGFGFGPGMAALLILTPAALFGAVTAPIAGTIAGRTGWLRTLRLGMGASLVLTIVIAIVHHDEWLTVGLVAALGIGFNGFVMTTLDGLGVVQTPPDAPAVLPGLNSAAFGIGAGIGIAVAAPFAGAATGQGFTIALWLAVVIAALAFGLTFIIKPRDTTA